MDDRLQHVVSRYDTDDKMAFLKSTNLNLHSFFLFPAGIFPARTFSRRNFSCVNYDKKCLFNVNLIDDRLQHVVSRYDPYDKITFLKSIDLNLHSF